MEESVGLILLCRSLHCHNRDVVVLAPGAGGFGYRLSGLSAEVAGAVKSEELALGVFGFYHSV